MTDDRDTLAMHLAIYKSRSDINGIVHGHSPNGRAFSIQGRPISMICQGEHQLSEQGPKHRSPPDPFLQIRARFIAGFPYFPSRAVWLHRLALWTSPRP